MSQVVPDGVYSADVDTAALQAAFTTGEFPVAVYGLGKMGLPLAAVFGDVTGNVVGADTDPDVVESVNRGDCHVTNEPGLQDLVAELTQEDALSAVEEPERAATDAAIHVLIVPTPITDDNEPDLSILEAATRSVAAGLDPGDLVIVECTVPPGTTDGLVRETLEAERDLEVGEFGLAFCPERTSSGRALEDIRAAYPKVVGGVDETSRRVAELLYEEINSAGVIPVSDARTAEAVKVFEGLYRDVNIALANELARFTDEMGVDVREAIEVANTQPFCEIHDPGPGVGGHCIPFYPYFMIEPFETEAPLLRTAREVNDAMPEFTVETLRRELEAEGTELSSASVLLLGLTYRPGVEESRASPSRAIAERLSEAGVDVFGVDPMLETSDEFALEKIDIESVYDHPVDGIVMVTPHEEFDDLQWSDLGRASGSVVIDGRDTLYLDSTAHRVYTIGRGDNV
ncbi:nucleotide sugar dehydrogenase [Halobacteriales archaeon QS_1_69_70]|nr:MAG: nucleotide sugar dehydrogenase [Halobacteriales archaeon QS_1_69_70]